jgi:WD40 repeat protein
VLVLAVTTVRALPDALAHSREARESLVAALAEYTALDAAAERGPYDALAAALALPEDAQGHFYHAALIEAASAKTPVDRGQLGDQTSAPFSFGDDQMRSSSDELAVVAQVDGKSAHVVLVDADTEALTASVVLPGTGRAAMFSPDGLTVAALSANGITLIDARHGTVWQELTGADFTALDDVAWSGDGRQVAAMDSSSGQVIVWQVLTETEVLARTNLWIMDSTTLGAAGGGAFLGRDGRIAVVGLSGTSAVDIVDGVLPAGVAGDIASSPSGTTAYVTFQPEGGAFGLVSIDLSSRSATPLPLPDGCSPRTVAVGPEDDGRIFVACGGRLVAVSPAGDVVSDTQTSIDHISTITVAADGTVFAGAAGGGAVTAFAEGITEQTTRGAIVTGSGLEVGTCGGGTPLVLRALPDSSRVYSVGQGTGLQLCARVLRRTNGGWEMSTPPVTDDSATQGRGLAVSPDGSLAAIGLADGSVQIVSAADSSIGWRWTEQYGEVRGVEFSLDSSYVVVGTRDGLITRVPAVADRLEASALRRVAQEMLDRATDLGFYAG